MFYQKSTSCLFGCNFFILVIFPDFRHFIQVAYISLSLGGCTQIAKLAVLLGH
jgi:hypothetical protein